MGESPEAIEVLRLIREAEAEAGIAVSCSATWRELRSAVPSFRSGETTFRRHYTERCACFRE